jgi:hypothetical protein
MNITFLITTYHRQESCQRLVDSLQGLGNIVVVKDGTGYTIRGCSTFSIQGHKGKIGYYDTVNRLFRLRVKADYYIMLPDDFAITPEQVKRAITIWDTIKDDTKICLNLYADRLGKPCWTRLMPVDMGTVYKTQWVDMCFICQEPFFDTLGEIPQQLLDWVHASHKSSGVGRYISLTLHKLGYSLYQVKESLAEPTLEHYNSQMKKQ